MEGSMFSYTVNSMFIHNSTLESFYLINDNQIFPQIIQDEKKVNQEAYSIAKTCNVIALLLHFFKSRLWVT